MNYDYILRWGNSMDIGSAPKVINRKQAIALCSHKGNMLRAFQSNGVSMPALYQFSTTRGFTDIPDSALPVIVRYKQHTQGSHFHYCETRSSLRNPQFNSDYHALKYINKDKEYRVFVWNNRVLEVNRKVREDNEPEGALFREIRNFKNGWWFKIVTSYNPDVPRQAVKAMQAIGLHYGAVDICVDTNNRVYVLEVNSAPGLIERKADMLIEAIKDSMESGEI